MDCMANVTDPQNPPPGLVPPSCRPQVGDQEDRTCGDLSEKNRWPYRKHHVVKARNIHAQGICAWPEIFWCLLLWRWLVQGEDYLLWTPWLLPFCRWKTTWRLGQTSTRLFMEYDQHWFFGTWSLKILDPAPTRALVDVYGKLVNIPGNHGSVMGITENPFLSRWAKIHCHCRRRHTLPSPSSWAVSVSRFRRLVGSPSWKSPSF